jgi:CRISPR/Cas system type I-B associated protein Csh2 (Cas7 group RAMP superfamily)
MQRASGTLSDGYTVPDQSIMTKSSKRVEVMALQVKARRSPIKSNQRSEEGQ